MFKNVNEAKKIIIYSKDYLHSKQNQMPEPAIACSL